MHYSFLYFKFYVPLYMLFYGVSKQVLPKPITNNNSSNRGEFLPLGWINLRDEWSK